MDWTNSWLSNCCDVVWTWKFVPNHRHARRWSRLLFWLELQSEFLFCKSFMFISFADRKIWYLLLSRQDVIRNILEFLSKKKIDVELIEHFDGNSRLKKQMSSAFILLEYLYVTYLHIFEFLARADVNKPSTYYRNYESCFYEF